jgi:hypothetical protein
MHGNPGEWLVKYMAPLKGAKIVDVTFKRDEELGDFPVLIVQPTAKQLPPSYWKEMANAPREDEETDEEFAERQDRAKRKVMAIEISRDEEGNGPGFPFGLPLPHWGR